MATDERWRQIVAAAPLVAWLCGAEQTRLVTCFVIGACDETA
jgi:hypothetical protein